MAEFPTVQGVLTEAVHSGEIPGAVALISDQHKTLKTITLGVRRYGAEATTADTYYDLASLTKVIATLPAILKLCATGALQLDDTVGTFIANAGWFQTPSLADVTIRQLLSHSSGLAAWKPLFAWLSTRQSAIANVLQTGITEPQGQFVYSDLGFMALGAIVERISRQQLDVFVEEQVYAPLGISQLSFGPLENLPVAATEDCPWRNTILQGVVHDENAYVLDGVAGHAGLFGSAEAVASYGRAWLRKDANLAPEWLLAETLTEHIQDEHTRRGLGWVLGGKQGFYGAQASRTGFGHTGFTGTSLWLEPEQGWLAVLLTNRVHPSRHSGAAMRQLRQHFHDAVAKDMT